MISLKNNHFLKLLDLTPAEITYLLDLAADLGMHPTYLDPTGSQIGKK